MRYGALDTAFVVRIGLIYGALTALVVFGYLLVTVAVGTFLSTQFAVDSSYVLVLLVAATALVVAPLRQRVQRLVDLAFYPSRRANREAIARLADRLTGLIETEAVLEHLGQSLGELFRPRTFAIVLAIPAPARGFVLRAAWPLPPGSAGLPIQHLPPDDVLTSLLDRERRPLFCEELEDFNPFESTQEPSWQLLHQLQASLLVPLVSGNRLLGFRPQERWPTLRPGGRGQSAGPGSTGGTGRREPPTLRRTAARQTSGDGAGRRARDPVQSAAGGAPGHA